MGRDITPLRIIIRSHFISRALVFLIRLERIAAFSDLSRMRKRTLDISFSKDSESFFGKKKLPGHFWHTQMQIAALATCSQLQLNDQVHH